MTDSEYIVKELFKAGTESVLPDKIIREILKADDRFISVDDLRFPVQSLENIYVIGAGKASALMAKEVENILGDKITDGHILTKYGYACPLQYIKLTEAGHPAPDENGCRGTEEMLKLVEKAGENDLVICLLSGGGSSLIADYPERAVLNDIIELNRLLLESGADIDEINTVRKHVSNVKGGQLAEVIYPAQLVSLILSDVIGDKPGVIASGPTSPDPTTYQDAENILKKYNILQVLPQSLISHLEKGLQKHIPETPKEGNNIFEKVYNLIIGSNATALYNAQKKSLESGIPAEIVTYELKGEVNEAARFIFDEIAEKERKLKVGEKQVLLFGGETTVKIKGTGLGGRNQHLALLISTFIKNLKGITVLCGGTDGNDGPTDAAGGIVKTETYYEALENNINIDSYLKEFDSYNFFKKWKGHLVTGPTFTNVMDLVIVLIEKD